MTMHGTCNETAACGRKCTLARGSNHRWHICRVEDCICKRTPTRAAYRGDQDDDPLAGHRGGLMDWATAGLAGFGLVGTLAGLWLGVM